MVDNQQEMATPPDESSPPPSAPVAEPEATADPVAERVESSSSTAEPVAEKVESSSPPDSSAARSAPKSRTPVFAWLVLLQGNESGSAIQLQESETIIGRDPTRAHIHIDNDATVSSIHAKIVRRPAEDSDTNLYTLYDLGSSNGTWSGDEETFERPLHDGDRFRLGRTELAFKCL